MARYALINAGVVETVAEGDAEWAAAVDADYDDVVLLAEDANVGRGHTYSGSVFAPSVEAVDVPTEVTMRQARRALHATGMLAAVDAAIDALSEPERTAARIEWEYSSAVQRHNGFVAQLAPALGLSESALDDLFVLAGSL